MNDDISLWRLFFRIVERGSLTKAADDHDLEPSSVSRRISSLEKRLNVRLLNRTTRQVAMTEAGSRAYELMKPLIDEMEGVIADLDGGSPLIAGTVRMTAPVNFGERHLVPWLTAFQRQHPQVLLDLVLSDSRIDLRGEAMDLALRVGELPVSDMLTRRIGSMPSGLYASLAYVRAHGLPEKPQDLTTHRAILYSLGQERHRTRLRLHRDGKEVSVELQGVFYLNNVGGILQAVRQGAGFHPGPRWLFQEWVDSGELVELLPEWGLTGLPVHLVRLNNRYEPKRVKALEDWIEQCWTQSNL